MRPATVVFLFAALLLGTTTPGWAKGYQALLEEGLFYLTRGASYTPDAVRSLEAARAADPARAGTDRKLAGALAQAYVATHRYTEALWLVEALEAAGQGGAEEATLRTRLLGEFGLARLRLETAVAVGSLTGSLAPAEGTRLEVAARRALERVAEVVARGVAVPPPGIDLLVPEGRYLLRFDGDALAGPRQAVPVEAWAGEEAVVRLVPRFPPAAAWTRVPGPGSVALAWPELPGASYRLRRSLGDGAEEVVYEGSRPEHLDRGVPARDEARYRLEIMGPGGALLAVSGTSARSLPPVASAQLKGTLGEDLRAKLAWALGEGAVDRLLVVREERGGDQVVLELTAGAVSPRGEHKDGPHEPEATFRDVSYRLEAWVAGEESPSAVARTAVRVPPALERVTDVVEGVDRGSVVISWDAIPRDGVADGYAIFRQKSEDVTGELLGRVQDPHGREFVYPAEDPLKASSWRHFVIPYRGERYLLDPTWLQVSGKVPAESLERRQRKGAPLPDLGLSWAPYPGARQYLVTAGDKEVLVRNPYAEFNGIQNALMGAHQRIAVFALDGTGQTVPLLTVEVQYAHYPRGVEGGKEP